MSIENDYRTYDGAISKLMLACVNLMRWVASSVLKTQLNTGSPSSEALQFNAYKYLYFSAQNKIMERTTQSSRRVDIAMLFMVTNGILRSKVVIVCPPWAVVMRMYTALPVYGFSVNCLFFTYTLTDQNQITRTRFARAAELRD